MSFCGLTLALPPFGFSLSFLLPAIPFPPPIPLPFLSFSLKCDLSNPVSVSAGVAWGGGRVSNADPDPDLFEEAA